MLFGRFPLKDDRRPIEFSRSSPCAHELFSPLRRTVAQLQPVSMYVCGGFHGLRLKANYEIRNNFSDVNLSNSPSISTRINKELRIHVPVRRVVHVYSVPYLWGRGRKRVVIHVASAKCSGTIRCQKAFKTYEKITILLKTTMTCKLTRKYSYSGYLPAVQL